MKFGKFCHNGLRWGLVACVVLLVPFVSYGQTLKGVEGVEGMEPMGAPGVESVLESASGGGESLKAALQGAMDANPKFLSQKHAYSVSHEAYLQSYGALLPQLDFSSPAAGTGCAATTRPRLCIQRSRERADK
jgi:adhesin transport system outer membrane protein